eukprot:3924691-Pleurochrysis_carterae.AAC.2
MRKHRSEEVASMLTDTQNQRRHKINEDTKDSQSDATSIRDPSEMITRASQHQKQNRNEAWATSKDGSSRDRADSAPAPAFARPAR